MVSRILVFKDCGDLARNRSARKSSGQRTAFLKAAVFNQTVKESKAGRQQLDFDHNMGLGLQPNGLSLKKRPLGPIRHDLGQRVRIIQKRNLGVDLKILS